MQQGEFSGRASAAATYKAASSLQDAAGSCGPDGSAGPVIAEKFSAPRQLLASHAIPNYPSNKEQRD